ncbi:hypothetical protein B0H14DRAFT_2590708 [Mycena olivaceomarginata]|nr:hypothetical protein B0H14DRAFT_2590708 [Mycena olivaceomarginata]
MRLFFRLVEAIVHSELLDEKSRVWARGHSTFQVALVQFLLGLKWVQTPTEFEGFPGNLPPAPHKGIPAPFLHLSAPGPAPDALAQLQDADDEDAADLDRLAYARWAPRPMGGSQSQWRSSGRSSGSGSGALPYSPVGEIAYAGMPGPKKSKSKRTTKSKSSATSSTLASPPPSATSFPHGVRDSPLRDSGMEFGAFTSGGAEDEFDGTPGGFDSSFGVEAEAEPEVVREALPSPGLSRGAGGFRFGGGAGWGGEGKRGTGRVRYGIYSGAVRGIRSLEFRLGGWLDRWLNTQELDFDFIVRHHCFVSYMCIIHLSAGYGCIDLPNDLGASIGPEALNAWAEEMQRDGR